MFLSDAGDDPNKVLLPGIFTNEMFDQNGVFYEIFTDTSGNTYLQYSTNENEAIYQAIFTDVGAGNGSYEIDEENNLNGRVYKYVGENQGRYNPVRKLIPPERKQMFSVGEIFNYSKKGQIQAEISLSNFDKNLFSNIDQEDNLSYAARMDWNHKFQFSSKKKTAPNTKSKPIFQDSLKIDSTYALKLPKNTLEVFAFGEYLDNHFNILNPYRNAEFQRDWNLILDSEQSSELLAGAGFNWSRPCVSCDKKTQKLNYEISTFQRGNIYSGTKQNIRSEFFTKSIAFEQSVSYLNTNSRIFNSTFIRPRATFDKRWDKLGKMHTGIFYDGEYNNKEDAILDTLLQGSNEYDLYKIYVSSDDSRALKTEIFYTRRIDRIASNNLQKTFAEADNYGANLGWAGKKTSFNMNLTYRILETQESLNQSIEDAVTFLGGLDYQYNLWDGIVRGVTNFNFNSGQEPKREFDYQEVAPGEGNFIWVDDGDGIADKNEFQPAPFADQGNYIQVSLFNNEFIQVYKQDYIQTLRIEPIKWKLSKKKWLKSLSRLSSQTSLRLSRKDMQENGLPDFQFYVLDETDADIVSFSSSINQSVFWNRGNPAYDILFNYLDNTSSLLLTTGNEIRSSELYSIKYRQNIKKTADLEFIVKRQNRSLRNINFNNNDYAITGYDGEINLSYRFKRKMEFRTAMKYNLKDNLLGIEQARSISNVSGISYTNTQKFRIDSQVSFNNIQYLSSDNQTIELVMLEGLKNGNNFLWELRFTKRLINNFDLSVSYNGRKTGTSKTVHVANAQIKATF